VIQRGASRPALDPGAVGGVDLRKKQPKPSLGFGEEGLWTPRQAAAVFFQTYDREQFLNLPEGTMVRHVSNEGGIPRLELVRPPRIAPPEQVFEVTPGAPIPFPAEPRTIREFPRPEELLLPERDITPTEAMIEAEIEAEVIGLRTEQQQFLEQAGEVIDRLFPGLAPVPEAPPPEELDFTAVEALQAQFQEGPEVFLLGLREQGRTEDTEFILQNIFGATEEEVEQFFVPGITELISVVLPEHDPDDVLALLQNRSDLFLNLVQQKGRSQSSQRLLRAMGLEWAEINDIFGTKKVFLTVEGTRKQVTIADNNMALNDQGQEIGRIDPVTQEFVPAEYRIGDTWKAFTAGVGDVAVTAGGALKWLGAEGKGERLGEFGQFLQNQAPADTLGEFTWEHLYNPRWWATKVPRTTAFTLSLVPAMIVGSWAGAAAALPFGVGAFGTFLFRTAGAVALARPMEAALEAGGTYDEALAKGMTNLEAKEAADEVFKRNLALAGVDAAQIALAFAPTPARVFSSLIAKGLVRTTQVGGRFVLAGLSEAGEEFYQEIIQRQALGEEIVWDAEMREVVSLGGIMGLGFQGGGTVYTSIKSRTIEALPANIRTQFDDARDFALSQGLKEARADEAGLDSVADQKEAQTVIEAVVEQARIDELEKEIKPKTKVDKLVWEKTFEQMREDAPQVPVVEVTGVTERIQPNLGGITRLVAGVRNVPGVSVKIQNALDKAVKAITDAAKPGLSVTEREAAGNRLQESLGNLQVLSVETTEVGNTEMATLLEEAASFVARTGTAVEPLLEELAAPAAEGVGRIISVEEARTILRTPPEVPKPPNLSQANAESIEASMVVWAVNEPKRAQRYIDSLTVASTKAYAEALRDKLQAAGEAVPPAGLKRAIGVQPRPPAVPQVAPSPAPPAPGVEPVEVAPIEHKGTEPEGIAIADALGVRFEGIQVGVAEIPSRMMFTDVRETGSTFTANTLEEARTKLADMRAAFAKARPAARPAPRAEPTAPEVFSIEDFAPVEPPLPDQTIPSEAVPDIPHIKDIGIIERVRPTRKVFEKMGLGEEIWKPAFKAEVELNEAREAFRKRLKEVAGWVGKDKERRALVFRELENPGSQVGLTFNEKRAVTWFRDFFNEWADTLNLSQDKRLSNYVTHIFEADITEQLKADQPLDPAISRMLEYKAPKTIFNPFLLERLGARTGLIEDPLKAAEAYSSRQLRVFYYEPLLQKLRLYADAAPGASSRYLKEFAQRLTGRPLKIDEEVNNTIREFADIIAKVPGGSVLANRLRGGNPSGMASYNFTSALYTLWLGFKPTSAIRNLSQHTLILAETGPAHFADGIRLRFTQEGKAAMNDSLVLRSRRAAFVPGIDDSFARGWTDKFREAALFAFRKADEQNVSDAFLAGYSEAKSLIPGADRQVWIDRGDEVAADTQYLYTKLNSFALSQSSIGRVFSVLTTWSENWLELMVKWGKGHPSKVYAAYEEATGTKLPKKNWSATRKSILLYMLIVGLGFEIKDRTRLKALEYTGLTSIRYIADIMGGDFPALEYPGAVADIAAGVVTDDERRLKTGLAQLNPKNLAGIVRQVDAVASGDRDWLTLLLYLEGQDWEVKVLRDKWAPGFRDYEALTNTKDRTAYREANPKVEAKMFVTNRLTTLSTEAARQEALRLIEEHGIDTDLIKGYNKVFGEIAEQAIAILATNKKRLGTFEAVLQEGEEVGYFQMNDFGSEVNKVVRQIGRTKLEQDGDALTRFYLEAKDLWVGYDDLMTNEARKLYRQQFPELEASLYMFGKVSTFENPKSATTLLKLMDKFGIPPEGVRAFTDNPEKYDELFTPLWGLRLKWDETLDQYEAIDEDTDELQRIAQREWLEENPDARMARKEIEVREIFSRLDRPADETIVTQYGEYSEEVFNFSANSPEAKLYRIDHELGEWGQNDKTLGWESLEDENVPVLRIKKDWRDTQAQYDAIDSDDREARDAFMLAHTDFRDDSQRREAYEWDREQPAAIVEAHVAYGILADERGASSAEVMLFRFDDKTGYNDMRTGVAEDHDAFLKPVDTGQVPIWRIDARYRVEDEKYDSLPVEGDARDRFLVANPVYRKDRRRRDGYEQGVPEALIEDHVTLYEEEIKGYRQERWLRDHPDYYENVWLNPDILGNSAIDFSVIPNEEYDNISDKWVKQIEALEAITEKVRLLTGGAKRSRREHLQAALYAANPGLEKDMLRRDGWKRFTEDLSRYATKNWVEKFATYYMKPAAGMEQELYLLENSGLSDAIGVGESTKHIESLRISVRYEAQDNLYESYGDTTSASYISDETRRSDVRRRLLLSNPTYAAATYRRDAYDEGFPDHLITPFAGFRMVELNRPEGWKKYWADDRYLLGNPELFAIAKRLLFWDRKVPDPDKVPSEAFERTWNEVYDQMRLPDGRADRDARSDYRGDNPGFDLEGARIGEWKPHVRRTPTGKKRFASLIEELAR